MGAWRGRWTSAAERDEDRGAGQGGLGIRDGGGGWGGNGMGRHGGLCWEGKELRQMRRGEVRKGWEERGGDRRERRNVLDCDCVGWWKVGG